MLHILKEMPLHGDMTSPRFYLEPPTEKTIEQARFSLFVVGLLGIVIVAVTIVLTELMLPEVVGYGVLFTECALMGLLYRRIAPEQMDATHWMLYAPLFAFMFVAWQMHTEQTGNILAYLFVGLYMLAVESVYHATWASLKRYKDDDDVFRHIYQVVNDYPEIAKYMKHVAASGRDWLVPAEVTAMLSYIENYEDNSEVYDMAETTDYRAALFALSNEAEEK